MADSKISALTDGTTPADTDAFAIARSGSSLKLLWSALKAAVYAPGGTDVAVTDGGTGASTAAGARTNLDVPSNAQAVLQALADAKGDFIVASAADTFARLAVGTNGAAPVADDSQSAGVQFRSGVSRQRDKRVAIGLIDENFPGDSAAANATVGTQEIHAGGVYLYKGETVTNILVCVTNAAAGTAPTLLKLGLWSSAATPVCLAVTADLKSDAMWASTGYKVAALSSPFAITADGLYYAAFLVNGTWGTTQLQLVRPANAFASSVNPIGSFPRRNCRLKTSATDMAVTDTGTYSAAGGYWFGVS